MSTSSLTFTPVGARGMTCELITSRGWQLRASGHLDEALPTLRGRRELKANRVITTNVWAFACQEKERRIARQQERRAAYAKRAADHKSMACNVADLVECAGEQVRDGWCSACYTNGHHRKVDAGLSIPTYLCLACGAATLTCAAPRCSNMATRNFGQVRIPRYCAEHRHDIPSFERGNARIKDLTDYQDLLRYEKKNLARNAKLAGSAVLAAGAMSGVGLAAAPLVGGAIGTMVGGYSGAAATSYGLAFLGGGSLAAGGFGMAGGTVVVAAVASGLGGIMGAGVTNAYVREDKSFAIEKLKAGRGVPILVCSGFLTEGTSGWGDWERIVAQRYPTSPVYRVHWGAEDLKALSSVLTGGARKAAVAFAVRNAAMGAGKVAAKKASPIGSALIAVDLVKNPWFRARQRANKTGVIVADLIARTKFDEVVLIGHSLGARAMICAAEAVGTKPGAPAVKEMHLLGAAIGAKSDWSRLNQAVVGTVYNYYSSNDKVLRFFYSLAQGGDPAAGYSGMASSLKGIKNVDVTKKVPGHSDYCREVGLK